MRAAGKAGKQNTENTRPVYTRELPSGRELVSAEPGAYLFGGAFVRRDGLGAVTEPVSGGMRKLMSVRGGEYGSVLVLPGDIVSAAGGCFSGTRWESVILSDAFREAEADAFAGSAVRYVRFPAGLVSAGDRSFRGCLIRNAVFPETTERIGTETFGTPALVSVFALSASAGEHAFASSPFLTAAGLPSASGDGIFAHCRNLVFAGTASGNRPENAEPAEPAENAVPGPYTFLPSVFSSAEDLLRGLRAAASARRTAPKRI